MTQFLQFTFEQAQHAQPPAVHSQDDPGSTESFSLRSLEDLLVQKLVHPKDVSIGKPDPVLTTPGLYDLHLSSSLSLQLVSYLAS